MKPIEEMNAMEVCAYLVAKTSRNELGEDEIRRVYDIHCAKLKKELSEGGVRRISDGFMEELKAEAGGDGGKTGRRRA